MLAEPTTPTVFTPIDETPEQLDPPTKTDGGLASEAGPKSRLDSTMPDGLQAERTSAQKELRTYELLALGSCFLFPLMAAWLLHGIRSQLTRPSEGLVSNYNLSIFILVAEIRPISHLIKLIQRRTLFLQRKVNADVLAASRRGDSQQVKDLSRRLDDLETHIADRITSPPTQGAQEDSEALAAKASTLASSDLKKTVQPELDALNRAMRRYEKRITISSVQFEARLQDLEARLNDVVALAAAAQRNADKKPDRYIVTLTNWLCAAVVLPVQYLLYVFSLPGKLMSAVIALPKRYVTKSSKSQVSKDSRASRRSPPLARAGERERRSKPAS